MNSEYKDKLLKRRERLSDGEVFEMFTFTNLIAIDRFEKKLIWIKDPDIADLRMNYYEAEEVVEEFNKINFAGYNDWRLPKIEDLIKLIDTAKVLAPESPINEFLNKKYKAAVIGCGSIGALKDNKYDSPEMPHNILTHAHAYYDCPDTELVAVIDMDIEKAKKAGDKWGCSTDTDILNFRNENIDIISVCTPTETHFDILKLV